MYRLHVKIFVLGIVAWGGITAGYSQALPEELKKSTLSEQIEYLNDHTRIYENYRAIREDMYRTVTRNTLDSLGRLKLRIKALEQGTAELKTQVDSLHNSLQATHEKLSESIRSKNSISLLGMQVNKYAYNTITWIIIATLVLLLFIGFVSFKSNRSVTLSTRKDLGALQAEFEAYRQKSRLEREQATRDHFNEIKRLKENNPSSRMK